MQNPRKVSVISFQKTNLTIASLEGKVHHAEHAPAHFDSFLCLLGLFCSLQAQDAPVLKIAALHPVLGDMARAIGGSRVQVADLLRPNGNLHSFEPSPQDIAAAGRARLVLASGKNLEPYLPKLKDALGGSAQILDLGASVPDVPVEEDTADHDHEHDGDCCAHGPNDPHWWHTPANMKRAARTLAATLTRLDPAHEQDYKAGLSRWNRKMDQLSSWARKELADIPERTASWLRGMRP